MTEDLKTLMGQRADAVDFDLPDIDHLVASGQRRVRRRRGLAVAGTLAAAVLIGGVLVTVTGDDSSRSDGPGFADDTSAPVAPAELMWVTGSVLHTPDSEVDLGHQARAFVRTSEGVVFADPQGVVWSHTDGQSTEVGTTDARFPRLVSDPAGHLVSWVDPGGEAPEFVVLDQTTGQSTVLETETDASMGVASDEENPAYVYALTGETLVLRDLRGAIAMDLTDGSVRVVDADARNGFDIIAARGDDVAMQTDDGRNGVQLGTGPDDVRVTLGEFGSSSAVFSPDGRLITLDGDEPMVYDTATGEQIAVPHKGFAVGYEWLDDTRLAVFAGSGSENDMQLDLRVCTIEASTAGATCTTEVELGSADILEGDFALPKGESFN